MNIARNQTPAKQICIRLDVETLKRVSNILAGAPKECWAADLPFFDYGKNRTRSDLIRSAIERGLASIEAEFAPAKKKRRRK